MPISHVWLVATVLDSIGITLPPWQKVLLDGTDLEMTTWSLNAQGRSHVLIKMPFTSRKIADVVTVIM